MGTGCGCVRDVEGGDGSREAEKRRAGAITEDDITAEVAHVVDPERYRVCRVGDIEFLKGPLGKAVTVEGAISSVEVFADDNFRIINPPAVSHTAGVVRLNERVTEG